MSDGEGEGAASSSCDTSLADDKGEGASPKRDVIADGIFGLLKPTVDRIDTRIKATRLSQGELHQELDRLLLDLRNIADAQPPPLDLEMYVNKLINCKRRVMVAHAQLMNAKERLLRIQQGVAKEMARRQPLSEPPPLLSPMGEMPKPDQAGG